MSALVVLLLSAPPPYPPDGSFEVTVVDEAGLPVRGAEVDPWALRMGGGHGAWWEAGHGPKPVVTTDARGVAEFGVPTRRGEDKLETVSAFVRHPDYVALYEHLDAGDCRAAEGRYEARLTMRPGTRLSIEVLALDGEVDLDDCRVAAPGSPAGDVRAKAEGGRLLTEPLPASAPMIRVTAGDAGGVMQFGDWTAWRPDESGTVELTAILQKGLTVRGRLSDDVPRPVRDGWVVADCSRPGPTYEHRSLGQTERPVAEDGTFELPNIPHGCDMQVVAICRGFTSAPPDAKTDAAMRAKYKDVGSNSGSIAMPQVFTPDESTDEVLVRMRPAAALRVVVTGPDGEPAEGVHTGVSPNDHSYGLGNWSFANGGAPSGTDATDSRRGTRTFEWRATTGPDGVAMIENIPPLRESIYGLYAGDFDDPRSVRELEFEGESSVTLAPGETAELKLRLAEDP